MMSSSNQSSFQKSMIILGLFYCLPILMVEQNYGIINTAVILILTALTLMARNYIWSDIFIYDDFKSEQKEIISEPIFAFGSFLEDTGDDLEEQRGQIRNLIFEKTYFANWVGALFIGIYGTSIYAIDDFTVQPVHLLHIIYLFTILRASHLAQLNFPIFLSAFYLFIFFGNSEYDMKFWITLTLFFFFLFMTVKQKDELFRIWIRNSEISNESKNIPNHQFSDIPKLTLIIVSTMLLSHFILPKENPFKNFMESNTEENAKEKITHKQVNPFEMKAKRVNNLLKKHTQSKNNRNKKYAKKTETEPSPDAVANSTSVSSQNQQNDNYSESGSNQEIASTNESHLDSKEKLSKYIAEKIVEYEDKSNPPQEVSEDLSNLDKIKNPAKKTPSLPSQWALESSSETLNISERELERIAKLHNITEEDLKDLESLWNQSAGLRQSWGEVDSGGQNQSESQTFLKTDSSGSAEQINIKNAELQRLIQKVPFSKSDIQQIESGRGISRQRATELIQDMGSQSSEDLASNVYTPETPLPTDTPELNSDLEKYKSEEQKERIERLSSEILILMVLGNSILKFLIFAIVLFILIKFILSVRRAAKEESEKIQVSKRDKKKLLADLQQITPKSMSAEEEIRRTYFTFLKMMEAANYPRPLHLPPTQFQKNLSKRFPKMNDHLQTITKSFCIVTYSSNKFPKNNLGPFRKSSKKLFDFFSAA